MKILREFIAEGPSAHPVTDEVFSPESLPGAVERTAKVHGWRAGLDLQTAHWDRYVTTHPEALLASLKALPGEAYVELPSLLVATNYLQHIMAGDDARRFHDFAHDEVDRPSDERTALDRLISSTGRAGGHRTAGRFEMALESARGGRATLDELSNRERSTIQSTLPHLLIQWGRAFEVNDAGGIREYEESWELANLTEQPRAARRAAACLAWLHADHGDLTQSEAWVARAHRITTASPRYDAPLHLASALTAIDRLDRKAMNRHLDALSEVSIGEYWAAEAWVRAWAASSVHEAVLVEKQLTERVKAHPERLSEGGSFYRYITASRARLAATQGEVPPPLAATDEPTPFDHVMIAAASYRTGDMHAVLREAAYAVNSVAQRMHVCGLLLTAAARLSLGRTDGASGAFTSAHARIEHDRLLSAYSVISSDHLAGLSELTGLPVSATLTPASPRGPAVLATLTRREREVLTLLASGLPLAAIASQLFISPNTVKGVTFGMYRKLGVHSRREAADVAHRAGLA